MTLTTPELLREAADLIEARNLGHLSLTWTSPAPIAGPMFHASGELVATVLAALPELTPCRRIGEGPNSPYIWSGRIGNLLVEVVGSDLTDDELAARGLIPAEAAA